LQAGDGGGDLGGPGPVFSEAEPQAPAAAGETSGDGEDTQAEPFRFPAAGGGAGQGEQLGPGEKLAGQGDDLAPELVLGEAMQGQVPQPGVLRAADPVLAPGLSPVP
jgi:hypothetical protein